MDTSPFCSTCNRFVDVEEDDNHQPVCQECHCAAIEMVPQDRIIDFDIAVSEQDDHVIVTVNNGDLEIQRSRQGGIAIKMNAHITLNRSVISRICNLIRPIFHFDLDGTLSAEDAAFPRPRFSNRVRDALNQVIPINLPSSASSFVTALPDCSPTEKMLSEECAICLNHYSPEDRIITLPCEHFFHRSCILQWVTEHSTCPICRETISGTHPVEELD